MSMAYVAVAIAAISAAVSAYSSVSAAESQAEAQEYNAKVAENEAQYAQDQAAYEEEAHRERVRKIMSAQRALYGTSGLEMSGSPLLTMQDTAAKGERDALAIRYGGDVATARANSEANLNRMTAKSTRTAGYLQAGSSLLSGASSAISKWPKK